MLSDEYLLMLSNSAQHLTAHDSQVSQLRAQVRLSCSCCWRADELNPAATQGDGEALLGRRQRHGRAPEK